MDSLKKTTEAWLRKAKKTKQTLENDAYEILTNLIKEIGEEKGDKIVINLEGNNNILHVMDYDGFSGDYIGWDITSIELSKETGEIFLNYGEDAYDKIKFGETLLSDRIYIIDEVVTLKN